MHPNAIMLLLMSFAAVSSSGSNSREGKGSGDKDGGKGGGGARYKLENMPPCHNFDDKLRFFSTPPTAAFVTTQGLNLSAATALNRHCPEWPHVASAAKPAKGHAAVMIFKLATTGSTWFSDVLNALPNVSIAQELITGDHTKVTIGSSQEHRLVAQMRRALITPTGDHGRPLKGGRAAPKDGWSLVGFTLNSKNLPFADYRAVLTGLPPPVGSARAVVFHRSNMIKYAVGLWRSKQLHKAAGCHTNNVRAKNVAQVKACALPETGEAIPPQMMQVRTCVRG